MDRQISSRRSSRPIFFRKIRASKICNVNHQVLGVRLIFYSLRRRSEVHGRRWTRASAPRNREIALGAVMSVFAPRKASRDVLRADLWGILGRQHRCEGAALSCAQGPCGASKSAGNVHGLNGAMRHTGIVPPSGARIADGHGGKRSAPETQRMPEAHTMIPLPSVEDAATA